MPVDSRLIEIRSIVFHDLPSKKSGRPVILSDAPSPIDGRLESYISTQVAKALSKSSYDIDMSTESESAFTNEWSAFLDDPGKSLVGISRSMALRLAEVQTASASDGLLGVAQISYNQSPGIIIMKVEKTEGIHVKESSNAEGHKILQLEHIDDLVLDSRDDLYKLAIVIRLDQDAVLAVASDLQRGRKPEKPVADYFIEQFLGCSFVNTEELATKAAFRAIRNAMSSTIADSAEIATVELQLQAEFRGHSTEIRPLQFISDNFPDHAKVEATRQLLKSMGQSATRAIFKDTGLITNELKNSQFVFPNGVQVLVPYDALENDVRVEQDEVSGETTFRVRGAIQSIKNR